MSYNRERRSSILKTPKLRNPLTDVDVKPPSEIVSTKCMSRRVSFANSNLIKEFTTDPEKNTIWHTSYEEDINTLSECSNVEQDDIFNCTAKNHTLIADELSDSNMEMTCINLIDTNDDTMELTNTLPTGIVFTRTQNTDLDINKENVLSHNVLPNANDKNRFRGTIFLNQNEQSDNMEFTTYIPNDIIICNQATNCRGERDRKLRRTILFDQDPEDGIMEITDVIPSETTLSNQDRQDDNVEITKALSRKCSSNAANKLNRTILLHQDPDDGIMERTNVVPSRTFVLNQDRRDSNMEITEALSSKCSSNAANILSRTILLDQDPDDGIMERTNIVPSRTFVLNQDRQDGNIDKAEALSSKCSSNVANKLRRTNLLDQDFEGSNMEFTNVIPSGTILLNQDRRDGNMEITKAFSIKCSSNATNKLRRPVVLDQDPDDGIMDRTNVAPGGIILLNQDKQDSNREITKASSSTTNKLRTTILLDQDPNDGNMECTNVIPSGTILLNQDRRNMDISKHLSAETISSKNSPNIENKLKKTILLDTEDTNMEFTKILPNATILSNEINAKNTFRRITGGEQLLLSRQVEADDNNIENNCSTSLNKLQQRDDDEEDVHQRKIQFSKRSDFNLLENTSMDNTEKLINYKISTNASSSEYSKILYSANSTETQANCEKSGNNIVEISFEDDDDKELMSFLKKSSVGVDLLSSENISLIDSEADQTNRDCSEVNELEENIEIELPDMSEHYRIYKIIMTSYLKLCKETNRKPIVNVQFDDEVTASDNNDDDVTTTTTDNEKSLSDRIQEKSKNTLWKFLNGKDDEFKITFMFESIEFNINLDLNTEIVQNLKWSDYLCELTSAPRIVYVHHVLKQKLLEERIKSACGRNYTIWSFLDYLTVLGDNMIDISSELDELRFRHDLQLDSNLNATIEFVHYDTRIAFEVNFNLTHLDTITEENINIKPVIGRVDTTVLKGFVRGCPQGFAFLKAFILNIKKYFQILETMK